MDTLKELSLILTRNKAKSIEVLDVKKHKESKINEFYYALSNNDFETDKAAAEHFYPGKQSDSNYRKLKASLKNRMINSLFFIDVKKSRYTDRQSAYYECYKDWAAANILLGKNAYISCVELCNKTLRYAQKYEFTELARDISKVLRLHYGAQIGDAKNYRLYRNLFEEYDEVCRWEDRAERQYSDLMIEYVNNKSSKEHLFEDAQKYVGILEKPMNEIDSYRLHLYGNLIQLIMHSIKNDYQKIKEVGERMASFFKEKEYETTTPLQIAYYYQLMACTQLKQYNQGKIVANQCLSLLVEGSFNWFKYYELFFTLAIHSEQYEEAYYIFKKIREHERMKFLPDNTKEIWNIYGAYLNYLSEANLIKKVKGDDITFRLGRFLNTIPIFSKDKRGMNIAILVIQILYFIQQGKYFVAIDKIEAIEKYCARYLHKSETIRSYYFIKMLLCIPQANFHRVAVERKTKRYFEKLAAIPLEEANQTYKIEIIPYESLWIMALNSLGYKSYVPRRAKEKSK